MKTVSKSSSTQKGVERKNNQEVTLAAANKAEAVTISKDRQCELDYWLHAELWFGRDKQTRTESLIEQCFSAVDPSIARASSLQFANQFVEHINTISSLIKQEDASDDSKVKIESELFPSKLTVTLACVVREPWDMAEIYSNSFPSGGSDKVFCSGLFKEYEILTNNGYKLDIEPEVYVNSQGEIMPYYPIVANAKNTVCGG